VSCRLGSRIKKLIILLLLISSAVCYRKVNCFLVTLTTKVPNILNRLQHSNDADWRIISRSIFRKWEGVVGTGWSWLRIGTGGGHL